MTLFELTELCVIGVNAVNKQCGLELTEVLFRLSHTAFQNC